MSASNQSGRCRASTDDLIKTQREGGELAIGAITKSRDHFYRGHAPKHLAEAATILGTLSSIKTRCGHFLKREARSRNVFSHSKIKSSRLSKCSLSCAWFTYQHIWSTPDLSCVVSGMASWGIVGKTYDRHANQNPWTWVKVASKCC